MAATVIPEDYTFEVSLEWGAFRFADLSLAQRIRIRRRARELWGGPIPEDERSMEVQLAFMLAELETACTEKPEGWEWGKLREDDMDRLAQLWRRYTEEGATFRTGVGTDKGA